MKIRQINDDTFEIKNTLFGFVTSTKIVFLDYGLSFSNFPNYNPMYNKETGEQLGVFKGIRIQKAIEAFQRLNNWKK